MSRRSRMSARAFCFSNVGSFAATDGARNQKWLYAPAGSFSAGAQWLRDTQYSHLVA